MYPNVGFYIRLCFSKDLLRFYRSVIFSHSDYVFLTEVGSAFFLGGALSLECYLFFTSASAKSQ
jgi:hypothetical protein